MATQGTAVIDFGSFPGKTDVTIQVASAAIQAGSLVEAWIFPKDTGTIGTNGFHTADEHILTPMVVHAHSVVAGVGFSITAAINTFVSEPLVQMASRTNTIAGALGSAQGFQRIFEGGKGLRLSGTYTVAWVWN